jgi:hypothetical protein
VIADLISGAATVALTLAALYLFEFLFPARERE